LTAVAAALFVAFASPQPVIAQSPLAAQTGSPGQPGLVVDPEEITSSQNPDQQVTRELTIGNAGAGELAWEVLQDPTHWLPTRPVTQVATVAPAGPPPFPFAFVPDLLSFLRPGEVVTPPAPPVQEGTVTLTHSESQSIAIGGTVACSATLGATTAANGFLRHFTLTDFDVAGDFTVTSVSFGIENVWALSDVRGKPQTLTVNLYTMTDPDGLFVYDNFDLIGTADAEFGSERLTIVEVPVTGTAPAGSTLVVEVESAGSPFTSFFTGSHPDRQTAPSYLRSGSCGIPEPTDATDLGFPGMQLLLNVTGVGEVPECQVPDGTPWVGVDALDGTVAPGGDQVVEVTFDSTGRSMGDVLSANLCLTSNDPDRPFVAVPLTMVVEPDPEIAVEPVVLAAVQDQGEVTQQTLSVGNVSAGRPLEWAVAEATAGCDQPASVPWLDASPRAGTTPRESTSPVAVTFDATELELGDHEATLCVGSNDPVTPLVEVPVELTVIDPRCDVRIVGVHPDPLTVTEGVTCLAEGSQVLAQVNVLDGAGLIATSAVIMGPVATFGATIVELTGTQITGPVGIRGTTGSLALVGNRTVGSVLLSENLTGGTPIVVAGNVLVGSLFCTGNDPVPVDNGVPNTTIGGLKLDQCAGL
jgi:hypothetical protein